MHAGYLPVVGQHPQKVVVLALGGRGLRGGRGGDSPSHDGGRQPDRIHRHRAVVLPDVLGEDRQEGDVVLVEGRGICAESAVETVVEVGGAFTSDELVVAGVGKTFPGGA